MTSAEFVFPLYSTLLNQPNLKKKLKVKEKKQLCEYIENSTDASFKDSIYVIIYKHLALSKSDNESEFYNCDITIMDDQPNKSTLKWDTTNLPDDLLSLLYKLYEMKLNITD